MASVIATDSRHSSEPQSKNASIELLNRLGIQLFTRILDILFTLDQMGQRRVQHVGHRWVVVLIARHNRTRLIQ